MIRVHEPGDIVYTRDAYHNIFRAMVDANGQLTAPPKFPTHDSSRRPEIKDDSP